MRLVKLVIICKFIICKFTNDLFWFYCSEGMTEWREFLSQSLNVIMSNQINANYFAGTRFFLLSVLDSSSAQGVRSLQESLSMTLRQRANGKNEIFALCLQLSVQ